MLRFSKRRINRKLIISQIKNLKKKVYQISRMNLLKIRILIFQTSKNLYFNRKLFE